MGPYDDADARHQFMQSKFHRSVDFCGSCHDVSNSVVGDLAPGNGAQPGSPHVVSSQDLTGAPNLGGPVDEKAAFNNPPYAYGVVERTFSEYKSSLLPETLVSDFNTLPEDLQVPGGSLYVTYQAALAAGTGGNYEDGDPRYFSCQSCHMRPTTSAGANKRGVLIRPDLPQHDHTGGNYWLTDMIKYQDSRGQLRLGGDLNSVQLDAIDLGQQRAVEHLQQAADLSVVGNTLKVVNLTGHKLISGYPEGRRMWLNIKWYDDNNNLLREDGEYGYIKDESDANVQVLNPADGSLVNVESIVDLDDPNTRIYQAHYAMTQEWAATLVSVGKPPDLVLNYDRDSGSIDTTLGDLAIEEPGEYEETFHFALNNFVAGDNRIPPYGMRYDEAKKRNALPVPASQYGVEIGVGVGETEPEPGSIYNYRDELDLNQLKPLGAVFADITLYYQGTSWEYIQFLYLANTGENAFLGAEGVNMLEAWINAELPEASGAIVVNGDRKMVPPVVMQQTTWGTPPGVNSVPICNIDQPAGNVTIDVGASINYMATANDSDGTIASYSWSIPGGSPGSSDAENPGNVLYSTAGVYETSFSATDNDGASCNADTVTITVQGAVLACSDHHDRASCKNDPNCTWSNKNKICLDK